MKHFFQKMALLALAGSIALTAQATTPEEDLAAFRDFFKNRFPDVPTEEYTNGVYAIDPVGRENWEAIEEFPPYEPFVDEGRTMWETPFANGKTYQDCFPEGPAMESKFPNWDKQKEMVMTLPLALNQCREANGEKPLKYKKGPISNLLAYIAFESRGQTTNVEIPTDDPKALAAYENGKKFYYTRRGQLNFSCATCHLQNAGMRIRSDILSPALGHTTHWPVYRSKWGELGTLHRRFDGCNKQVRAKPFKAQSDEYKALEYFETYMSEGLPVNAPSMRQ